MNWRTAPKTEDRMRWQAGVVGLNEYLEDEKNQTSLAQLFTSTIIDPEPTTFNDFQNILSRYLSSDSVELLLTVLINHDLSLLESVGANAVTIEVIGTLVRNFSSRVRRGFLAWMMTPLDDWFRINTELTIRSWSDVHFSHTILKNDGSMIQFSSNVSGTLILISHLFRHIEGGMQVLGDESVLGTIDQSKLEHLKQQLEQLLEKKQKLDSKIAQMSGKEDGLIQEKESDD